MSTQPIQDYYDCLSAFATKLYDKVDKNTGLDLNKVGALVQQGCLSGEDVNSYDGPAYLNVSITPHGAVILAEWQFFLQKNSFKGQLVETLGKLAWLFAGMLITVGGALLLKVVE